MINWAPQMFHLQGLLEQKSELFLLISFVLFFVYAFGFLFKFQLMM